MPVCPSCHGPNIVKNGKTYYGKQNHRCKDCGRQFVLNNSHSIDSSQRTSIKRALNERISLRGICRVFKVSLNWLLDFAVQVWQEVPADLGITHQLMDRLRPGEAELLVLQLDEAWSFVGKKTNKCWIWVVFDPVNRLVLAFHIGGRDKKSAQALWDKIPDRYKCRSGFATDYWEAYNCVVPANRHLRGKAFTFIIEGFFAGMRARVSRLVRKNLAFSKKWLNHELALRFFFWNFNRRHPYI